MSIRIRQAGSGDEQAIVDLVREMAAAEDYPTAVDVRYARDFLASPTCGVLLAVDGDEPVGLLSFATVPGLFHAADSGLIEALVVTEGRRGEGIGGRLLRAALKLLEAAGCAEISVSTGADNEVAQKLYVDAGLNEASVLLEKHVGP
jgi:ribosomal protein S18 acetylase RimI-like enzyme